MVVTNSRQRILFEKLLVLARGDERLVEAAIRENTPARGRRAELKKVVDFILKNRAAGTAPTLRRTEAA